MHCPYFQAKRCMSCSWLEMAYAQQLARKQQGVAEQLPMVDANQWQAAWPSAEQGYRNKAKMVVLGTSAEPVLGIVQPNEAVDLTGCPLYPADFQFAFAQIKQFIQTAGLQPYDVATRKGELKFVLLSRSQSDGWMLRFVLRSQHHVAGIRKHLQTLRAPWPDLKVVSINLQPEHKAILEGEHEIVLTEHQYLPVEFDPVRLYLAPQSFFQTNTEVAKALYQTAKDWCMGLPVNRVWDLFCGVGGFALHLSDGKRQVTGIEISQAAITAASRSAAELGVQVDFRALDATAFALAATERPELLVVNPPRRGLGSRLCQQISQLAPNYLLYSSCNPETLAHDLERLPEYRVEKAQLFDMFPHTAHAEVLLLLVRE